VELHFIFYFDQVPGMYTSEEIEALLAPLKEVAADEGYGGSLFSFYAQRACISIYFFNSEERACCIVISFNRCEK
jgi:hypothetical protein